jgi:hypothetical protein
VIIRSVAVEDGRAHLEIGRKRRHARLQWNETSDVQSLTVRRLQTNFPPAPHKGVVCSDSGSEDLRIEVPESATLDGGTLFGVKTDCANFLGGESADELEGSEERLVGRSGTRGAGYVGADAGRDVSERSCATAKGGREVSKKDDLAAEKPRSRKEENERVLEPIPLEHDFRHLFRTQCSILERM